MPETTFHITFSTIQFLHLRAKNGSESGLWSVVSYRFGFNHAMAWQVPKENDNEVKGNGNQQDYGMRIYDPRLGRFLSADPLIVQGQEYPELSPYQFASNTPIQAIDLDGLESAIQTTATKDKNTPFITQRSTTAVVPVPFLNPDGTWSFPEAYVEDQEPMSPGVDGSEDAEFTLGIVASIVPAGQVFKFLKQAINIYRFFKRISQNVDDEVVATEENANQTPDALKNRVKLREGTKKSIREAAPKTDDGSYIDPNTGQPIEPGEEVFGHKPGQEWRRYQRDPANQSKTRGEVIEDQNNPDIYHIEDRRSNASHRYEAKPTKQ